MKYRVHHLDVSKDNMQEKLEPTPLPRDSIAWFNRFLI
jgi:hypothetical protein